MCREGRHCFPLSRSSRSSPPSPRRCRSSSPSTRRRSSCLSCSSSPLQRSCLFLHPPPCSRWPASVSKVAPSGNPSCLSQLSLCLAFQALIASEIPLSFQCQPQYQSQSLSRAQPPPNWRYLPPLLTGRRATTGFGLLGSRTLSPRSLRTGV